jgi:H+/gluconate symporter-like permease
VTFRNPEEVAVDDDKQSRMARLAGLGLALVAAWAAQQLISAVWQRSVGHKPPKPEDTGDARMGEIALAAAITGAVVALSRVLATRGAAKYFG